ncbi:K+ channel tetramerization subfamily protein [Gigaspora margarita]|uniref:K+ channel tetramerization subfamily protein n=1 Tax=Gigaspora margarita TaxID=4874 RepID=A0A8H3X1G4_GIGMA|nr:K+ channel tetramerization subfamily protein [Gigaspora margarita]
MKDNQTANNRNGDALEQIVLNVGGIRYETYRSTLTSYPNTLLGTMFAERNKALLHPINGNEYFIDRNGYTFYYILEFYRTGKIFWREHQHLRLPVQRSNGAMQILGHQISREELEEELHYFQLPINSIWSSLTQRAAAARLDSFVAALKEVIYQVLGELKPKVEIDFRRNKHQPHVKIYGIDTDVAVIFHVINNIVRPFGSVGYALLDRFGAEIGCHIQRTIPELHWELQHVDNYNWYCVKMSTTEEFDYDKIIQNSCLASAISTKPMSDGQI